MSTASPARIEANRKNAAHSTGPRTPEGKAISRTNAFKHGLTGDGIVAPVEDLARIAAISKDLYDEYQPSCTIGRAMLDRAAMLMVRLDRAGIVELAIVADSALTAVCEFDQFRRDWADELFDGLDADPAKLDELQTFPEGIDRLIAEWTWLASVEDWSEEVMDRLARFSDAGKCAHPVIRSMIPGEIQRLEDIKESLDRRPMLIARKQAAELGFFSMEPRAILARRYEAATERALHKAMQTFFEVEDEGEVPIPAPLPSQITATTQPLGSFSRETAPPPSPRLPIVRQPEVIAPIAPKSPVERSKRPDPKKLREAQRRKQR